MSMLKRQRPASPPPTSSSIPLIPSDSIDHRHTKRRRTEPPALDGPSRSWGTQQGNELEYQEEHDEENYEEDEEESMSQCEGTVQGEGDYGDEDAWHTAAASATELEYKSANSLLHEVHALYQHRLTFLSRPHSPCHKIHASSPLDAQSTTCPGNPAGVGVMLETYGKDQSGSGDVEEVERVRQRYEETNKLLGSLFLSRRREIVQAPHHD